MATDHSTFTPTQTQTTPFRTFLWHNRRRTPLRRQKQPTVRLGGKRPRRGLFLVRLVRRARLRWLKLKYSNIIKKLKNYYESVVKDIMEAGGTTEMFHQRLLLETSFAVPVMGISFSSFPSSSVSRF